MLTAALVVLIHVVFALIGAMGAFLFWMIIK